MNVNSLFYKFNNKILFFTTPFKMKPLKLTKEQKEELEKFGANTWFVEYLHKQFLENSFNYLKIF